VKFSKWCSWFVVALTVWCGGCGPTYLSESDVQEADVEFEGDKDDGGAVRYDP
jgi:predicted small lipoprotein YifL